MTYFWFGTTLLWLGFIIYDRFTLTKWRKDMADGIAKGLQRRVILIEGRCAKCNERIPDDKLTKEDLARKDSIAVQ